VSDQEPRNQDISEPDCPNAIVLWRLHSLSGTHASCAIHHSDAGFLMRIVVDDDESVVEYHRSALAMLDSSLAHAESFVRRGWRE
jgi:hypothetical protein